MSSKTIPYQLRPNKFIDRQLFIDLLTRVLPKEGNEKYIYVSMGGRHLIDHNTVYKNLGITNLFSFDNNEHIVKRQYYNRPINTAICSEMSSGSLPTEIESIFESFSGTTNLIAWLDYTDPHSRKTQLQELIELLQSVNSGDIIRITLNANIGTLEGNESWKDLGFTSPSEFRLHKLKSELDQLVPEDVISLKDTELPMVLAKCVELAFSKAESRIEDLTFHPLLVTSYKDGQRMLTVTAQARSTKTSKDEWRSLKDWPFKAKDWTDIEKIDAPDLSLKEKLKIDGYLHKGPSYILERLNFLISNNKINSIKAITSYKRFHRFYPEFRSVDR